MTKNQHMNGEPVTPWHRQFWPWFLIVLLSVVFIACVITAVLALTHDDSRVVDDYYKDGLAINQQLNADHTAQQLGLQAQLQFDRDGSVALQLSGDLPAPAQLRLQLIHPLDSSRDQTLLLDAIGAHAADAEPLHVAGHDYAGQLTAAPSGRWHLLLDDPADARWRLRAERQLDANGSTLTLRADATKSSR